MNDNTPQTDSTVTCAIQALFICVLVLTVAFGLLAATVFQP